MSRTLHRVILAIAVRIPARTPRIAQLRAERFAGAVVGIVERHSALSIAVTINIGVVFLLSLATTVATWKKVEGLNVEIGGFIQSQPPAAPPSGGSSAVQASLDQAIAEMLTSPSAAPASVSSVTTVAPSPLLFEIQTPTPSSSLAFAPVTSNGGGAASTDSQSTKGVKGRGGKGEGTGAGAGSGREDGERDGDGSAGGKGKGITSLRGLEGWDLVVLVDQSDMVGDGGGYLNPGWRKKDDKGLPAENTLYMKFETVGLTLTMPIKLNATLLPNALSQKNTILEAVAAYDDNLQPDKAHRRGNGAGLRPDNWKLAYLDLLEAAEAVLPKYQGRKNTAIVIGSEFEWLAKESTEESRQQAQAILLGAKLPIFFISLGARPDDWIRETAKKSGGAYLGYFSRGTALALSKNRESVWMFTVHDGEPRYERGNAPEAKSSEIIAGLGESNVDGLTEADALKKADQQSQ